MRNGWATNQRRPFSPPPIRWGKYVKHPKVLPGGTPLVLNHPLQPPRFQFSRQGRKKNWWISMRYLYPSPIHHGAIEQLSTFHTHMAMQFQKIPDEFKYGFAGIRCLVVFRNVFDCIRNDDDGDDGDEEEAGGPAGFVNIADKRHELMMIWFKYMRKHIIAVEYINSQSSPRLSPNTIQPFSISFFFVPPAASYLSLSLSFNDMLIIEKSYANQVLLFLLSSSSSSSLWEGWEGGRIPLAPSCDVLLCITHDSYRPLLHWIWLDSGSVECSHRWMHLPSLAALEKRSRNTERNLDYIRLTLFDWVFLIVSDPDFHSLVWLKSWIIPDVYSIWQRCVWSPDPMAMLCPSRQRIVASLFRGCYDPGSGNNALSAAPTPSGVIRPSSKLKQTINEGRIWSIQKHRWVAADFEGRTRNEPDLASSDCDRGSIYDAISLRRIQENWQRSPEPTTQSCYVG